VVEATVIVVEEETPEVGMTTNAELVRDELARRFQRAANEGRSECIVISGELHDSIKFRQGSHRNQMPTVSTAMHSMRRPGDTLLHTTPSGKSSTIKIAYKIPRPR
jgi:hypothetical protein